RPEQCDLPGHRLHIRASLGQRGPGAAGRHRADEPDRDGDLPGDGPVAARPDADAVGTGGCAAGDRATGAAVLGAAADVQLGAAGPHGRSTEGQTVTHVQQLVIGMLLDDAAAGIARWMAALVSLVVLALFVAVIIPIAVIAAPKVAPVRATTQQGGVDRPPPPA